MRMHLVKTVRPSVIYFFIILSHFLYSLALFVPSAVTRSGDSGVYDYMAKAPIISKAFLAGPRPPVVPLFYKMIPHNDDARTWFQLVLYLFCWVFLAVAFCLHLTCQSSRYIAMVVILAFSTSYRIMMWNRIILSESISTSFYIGTLAAFLWYLNRPSTARISMACLCALLMMFARETNAFLVLFVVLVLLPFASIKRFRSKIIIISSIALCLFSAALISSNVGDRWFFPFLNLLGKRITVDKVMERYFIQHGMPRKNLSLFHNKYGTKTRILVTPSSPFRDLYVWIHHSSKITYARFFLEHPNLAVEDAWFYKKYILSPDLHAYLSFNRDLESKSLFTKILFPESMSWLGNWLIFVLLCAAYAMTNRDVRSALIIALGNILFAVPLAILIWNADAMEIARHSLQVGVMVRLGGWLVILITVDSIAKQMHLQKPLAAKAELNSSQSETASVVN